MKAYWGEAKVLQCDTCGKVEFQNFRRGVIVDGVSRDFCNLVCEKRYRDSSVHERRYLHSGQMQAQGKA